MRKHSILEFYINPDIEYKIIFDGSQYSKTAKKQAPK